MKRSPASETLVERVETGAGRRELELPVAETYSLADLLPRRREGLAYRVPGEMGASLASAFERTFALVERGYGRLSVKAPARLLTPRWHRVLNHLVRRGFARTLVHSQPLERGVPLFYFDIAASFPGHETDGGQPQQLRYCRGFSDDYDEALAKVVGECLERGALLYFRVADLVRSSPRLLRAAGVGFIEPGRLAVFAPWQVAERPELAHDDDSLFHWTTATSLVDGAPALVPAQLVYWNYPVGHGDVPEPLLREQSTHGAGGFYSREGAILSGLLECIQRDGFFRHWLRRVVPPRVDPAGIVRRDTLRLVAEARAVGLEPVFLDITSELGVPTCLCVLLRADDDLPHATMGASCRLDGDAAIHDALLEAASVHHILGQATERLRLADDHRSYSDATFSTPKRLAFWANPEHAEHLRFFLEGRVESVAELRRGVRPTRGAAESLDLVLSILRRHAMDVWYVEARHEALDELGYASVRVIAPDLIPMYCEDRNAPLGHPRLRSVDPGSLGRSAWPPWPHPFP